MSKIIRVSEIAPPLAMVLITSAFALVGNWVNCFVSFVGTAVSLWYTVKGVRERISQASTTTQPTTSSQSKPVVVKVEPSVPTTEPQGVAHTSDAWKTFFQKVTEEQPKPEATATTVTQPVTAAAQATSSKFGDLLGKLGNFAQNKALPYLWNHPRGTALTLCTLWVLHTWSKDESLWIPVVALIGSLVLFFRQEERVTVVAGSAATSAASKLADVSWKFLSGGYGWGRLSFTLSILCLVVVQKDGHFGLDVNQATLIGLLGVILFISSFMFTINKKVDTK